jgi:CheY-like chemotaxis protein
MHRTRSATGPDRHTVAAPRARRAGADDGGLSVLVVDDYADAADSLAMLVRLWGHRAEVAASGADALRVWAAGQPDVLLLELRLPDVDGCEVARQVRARPGRDGLLIAAVTTCGQDDDRRRAAAAGIDLVLVKPCDPADLLAALGSAVAARGR